MEIEDRIRTRIEAILVNDAKNYSEIKAMAEEGEPLESDALADERSLYHRIINSYRDAVSEVNKLLEENIRSLSGFYRILEDIKGKEDFHEICIQIVHCILQDFGVDYCSFLLSEQDNTLCLEGIHEDRLFFRVHSKTSSMGTEEFERELTRMARENPECLNIEDVYKEPRFNTVDFPGIVRSVLCLPVARNDAPIGFLILSHSLPNFFQSNHIRVLKIFASLIAHLELLHRKGRMSPPTEPAASPIQSTSEHSDVHAVVLMDFDVLDACSRRIPLGKESVREIRSHMQSTLQSSESVLFYREGGLLAFLPGVAPDSLAGRACRLREAFHQWQRACFEKRRHARIHLGFSVCGEDEDLAKTLEVAALVMHPETDGIPGSSVD
jgi:putative methionine-R-sulfoxide reductase with GAF domain